MTQVVTVRTEFSDLNQMAQGLVERVDETRVILPGPERVNEGEWVQFAVNLIDGTPGFAGVGRCVTAVDNGDERPAEMRFDLVIDSLQFDQRGQDIYQHILLSRQALIQHAQGDHVHAAQEGPYGDEDEPTVVGDSLEMAEPQAPYAANGTDPYLGAPEAAPHAEEVGADDVSMVEDDELELSPDVLQPESREVVASGSLEPDYEDVEPAPVEDVEPAPIVEAAGPAAFDETPTPAPPAPVATGAFVYPDGLPFPEVPPRPNIDPSLAVSPAPRPASADDAHAEDGHAGLVGQGDAAAPEDTAATGEHEATVPMPEAEALAALSELEHGGGDPAPAAAPTAAEGEGEDEGWEALQDETPDPFAEPVGIADVAHEGEALVDSLDRDDEPTVIADEGFAQALESDPDSEVPPAHFEKQTD